jgi:hypothetical protein
MSLEDRLHDIDEAIRDLTVAIRALPSPAGLAGLAQAIVDAPITVPPRRGRPPKAAAPVETPVAAPVEVEGQYEVPVVAPKAAEPPPVTEITKQMLQNTLIGVVKKHGRDECGKLCRAHGGPNLSALDPAVYPALYADALKALAREPA